MSEEQKSSQDISLGQEEEILDFEFDDLSAEGEEQDSSQDEEIIELVDIVEEEESPESEIGGQTIELSEEVGKSFEIPEEPQEALDEEEAITFPDLEEEREEPESVEASQEELNLEPEAQVAEDATQSLELDLESALKELEPSAEKVGEVEEAPSPGEEEQEGTEGFELEDLAQEEPEKPEEFSAEIEQGEPSVSEQVPTEEPPIAIDEERLEQIVVETVERVVEKAARQAMVEVAERLISEAIQALKESLEEGDR